MTLDEIEEKIRTLCGSAPTQDGHVRGDVEAACNIAMALVAHVRALENVTRMTDDRAFERITALEAKVAALGQLKTFIEVFRDGNAELVRLRVENAELRKVNANVHHVAAEYEERIAALEERDRLRTKTVEEQPQWPAPQPIETAPLGEILAGPAPNGFAWAPERPLAGCSLESWRTQLREAERRWWLHMPPLVGKMAAKDKADAAFIAEVAEVSAQMEALEAKWNACTEDHKGRSTDRPCPACGFGG